MPAQLKAYATYDLSNWATLRGWPAQVAVVDILWGAIASARAALAACWAGSSKVA